MGKTFYVTTPLYYVNAPPHIGHSYTTVAADCLSRYHRLKGEEVLLLTGSDEHGQKIAQAAATAGQAPQAFADRMVERFSALWAMLGIRYDDFIRTTQPRHTRVVQAVLSRLHEQGKLVRAAYQGWYCTPCETFWTEEELGQVAGTGPTCLTCGRALEAMQEEGWHLPLRPAQPWLRAFVHAHPGWIKPVSRYNELASLLEQPLPESLCLTRPTSRVSWGIPVPFSPDHVTYVWFDALLNYITVPGYLEDPGRFERLWPADVQFIGKDILRHHAVYWPIILQALGFSDDEMPRLIMAHGWWKVGEQKMSKSLGNIVDPTVVIQVLLKDQPYAADAYRYFLLREIPFGQDGSFSEDALLKRLHADLANDLGNLINRVCAMIERYGEGRIPGAQAIGCAVSDEPLKRAATTLVERLEAAMERLEFSAALEAIMALVTQANRYLESEAPWKMAKQPGGQPRVHTVLNTVAEATRIVALTLEPFMPSVASAMWRHLGCGEAPRRLQDAARWGGLPAGQAIGPHPILFPRSGG